MAEDDATSAAGISLAQEQIAYTALAVLMGTVNYMVPPGRVTDWLWSYYSNTKARLVAAPGSKDTPFSTAKPTPPCVIVPKDQPSVLEIAPIDVRVRHFHWLNWRQIFRPKAVTFTRQQRAGRQYPRALQSSYKPSPSAVLATDMDQWESWCDLDYFSHFLDLPREIRDAILDQLIGPSKPRCLLAADYPLSALTIQAHHLPGVCFANRQLHREGLYAWLRHVRFHIPSEFWAIERFDSYMDQIQGWPHVRCLTFLHCRRWAERYQVLSPAELAAKCTGLHKLRIEFPISTIINNWRMKYTTLKVDSLLKYDLHLDPLFILPKLRYLTVGVVVPPNFRRVYFGGLLPQSVSVASELKKAIDQGFEDAGKKANVEIEYLEIERDM
ncbi:hypothetical protein FB567DRAFT_589246 [Paraphoma chrysanthemicola]|uniref:Uncharacterized protein n=1 Tax=Paraphoma chrysanthemicola TaxID=798071 RepID=A0A8K0W2L1_9PLEO|nr:hypothetical protein FB567DRAFT_589246 [Paraphoma chrysanthemicola]